MLVDNAAFVGDSALQGWVVPFAEQRIDAWRRALEVNLTAPFHLVQLLHPMLSASGHGAVVNVASLYGVLGPDMSLYEGTQMGNPAAYAASKGGVVQLPAGSRPRSRPMCGSTASAPAESRGAARIRSSRNT